MQYPYPILSNEPPVPSWQTAGMAGPGLSDDSPFDRELVRAKMKEYGLTQADLAREMGLHQSAVHNMLAGKRGVSAAEASYIYRRLNIDRTPDVHMVPIIGLTSAGNWREAILRSGGVMPVPKRVASDRAFAVEVVGDSMDRIIPDGGYAVVDPDQTQLYNDKVYLIANEEHDAQVKLYRSNPARFEPASNNELHQTLIVGEQNIKVIGRVVWQGAPL
jgi:repressor LexA